MTPQLTRRRFLRTALISTAAAGLIAGGGVGYAAGIEPAWLALARMRVPVRDLPPAFDGFRIAHLTDLHVLTQASHRTAQAAIRMALDLHADAILLTGDYITGSLDAAGLIDLLRPLVAPDGVYATLGNHDHWVDASGVRRALSAAGIVELRNTAAPVMRGSETLWLAGVDDIWQREHDLGAALSGVPDGSTVVLLAHEPDFADEAAATGRIALQLSGHSHGGQVVLPLAGAPFAPHLGSKYVSGLYRVGTMWLYTNRGVGNLHGVRFNCRPEVAEITLASA